MKPITELFAEADDAYKNNQSPLLHQLAGQILAEKLPPLQQCRLWNMLGLDHARNHRHQEAVTAYNNAIAARSDQAPPFLNRLTSLKQLGRLDDCFDTIHQLLLRTPPTDAPAHKIGVFFMETGYFSLANSFFQSAIIHNPQDIQYCWHDLGWSLSSSHNMQTAAIAFLQAMLRAAADDFHPDLNFGISRLLCGDYSTNAWKLYEHRVPLKFTGASHLAHLPPWQGQSLATTHPNQPAWLVISGEQGIGERLLFSTMLADLAAHTPHILVVSEHRLLPLWQRSWHGITFITEQDPFPAGKATAHLSLGFLGKFFRNSPADIPKKPASIIADHAKAASIRARYRQLFPQKRLIGLSWKSTNKELSLAKSASLQPWLPLLQSSTHQFINLQHGERNNQTPNLYTDSAINQGESLEDFAAQIAALDCVITTSSTTAHMAASLGKTTLVLLPHGHGLIWYWGCSKNHTPWYPSCLLLRRTQHGSWQQLIPMVSDWLYRFFPQLPVEENTPFMAIN